MIRSANHAFVMSGFDALRGSARAYIEDLRRYGLLSRRTSKDGIPDIAQVIAR